MLRNEWNRRRWKVIKCQASMRMQLLKLRYRSRCKKVIMCQSYVRMHLSRLRFLKEKQHKRDEVLWMIQHMWDAERVMCRASLYLQAPFPELERHRCMGLLIEQQKRLRRVFIHYATLQPSSLQNARTAFKLNIQMLQKLLRDINLSLGKDHNMELEFLIERTQSEAEGFALDEVRRTLLLGSRGVAANREASRERHITMEQFYEVVLQIASSYYPSAGKFRGRVSTNFERFLEDFGPKLDAVIRTSQQQTLCTHLEDDREDPAAVLKKYNVKLARLHKFYTQSGGVKGNGCLGVQEFLVLVKDSRVMDTDISASLCIRAFMMVNSKEYEAVVNGKRYTNLYEQFQMAFEGFCELLVILAIVKSQVPSSGTKQAPTVKICLEEMVLSMFFENPHTELRLAQN